MGFCRRAPARSTDACVQLSPRSLLQLYDVRQLSDSEIVIVAGVAHWNGGTKPLMGSTYDLLYERLANGEWKFVRLLGGTAG